MGPSIWNRKLDLMYLTFFLTHIPVMLLVDLTPLYPASIKPEFLTTLRTWYITTYRDQFFTSPPAWFGLYMWMEALYHLPVSIWAVGGLLRDDPKVPIQLLVFGTQTAVTTMTCIADYLSWTTVSASEKMALGKLYVPYLALSIFMAVDMYSRLDKAIDQGRMTVGTKKKL